MTKTEEIYVTTVNLLGSDQRPDWMQDLVNAEHLAADPSFRPAEHEPIAE